SPPPVITITSPLDGDTYPNGPATLILTAGVSENGHTIDKVQFYSAEALLGEAAAAPYSFTWTNVSLGSYSVTARVLYDSGSEVDSPPVSFTVFGLIPPWQSADIGTVVV